MIPKKLQAGQALGVIAPSDPVMPQLKSQLRAGIQTLKKLGFQIKLSPNLYTHTLGFAASPEEKAADIHAVFADPEIDGILCAQGGDSANAPLALLDWELIRQMFEKTLLKGKTGAIPPNGPRKTIRRGQAEGKLLGGNLRCLLKLAGTPYWPDFGDAILFIEAYQITPKACHTAFHQLAQMGVFDQISGVVVGYIDSMQRDSRKGLFMEDVLLQVCQDWNFPILKTNDFGHNCPNAVLPVGGRASMDADRQILEITEKCVL